MKYQLSKRIFITFDQKEIESAKLAVENFKKDGYIVTDFFLPKQENDKGYYELKSESIQHSPAPDGSADEAQIQEK